MAELMRLEDRAGAARALSLRNQAVARPDLTRFGTRAEVARGALTPPQLANCPTCPRVVKSWAMLFRSSWR